MTGPSDDELKSLGYKIIPVRDAHHLTPPRKGWHTVPDKALVVEYPNGGYCVTETGNDANAWALARGHARREMIR